MSLRMNRFGKPLEIGNPNSYKPYINYKWATKIDALGNRDLIDSGKARLNADLYFGQHMLLNGVDQQITINTVNAVAIYVFRNGVFTTIDVGLVDSYTLSDNATYSNAVSSGFIFSDAQITYFVNTPEKFLYYEKEIQADSSALWVHKSKILTDEELLNVVSYLPMCENDGYVRDLVGYSEGGELIKDGTFDTSINWVLDSGWTINGTLKIDVSVDTKFASYQMPLVDGDVYLIECDVIIADGSTVGLSSSSFYGGSERYFVVGKYRQVVISRDNSELKLFSLDTANCEIDNFSVKKLTSTYPIQNYTSAVRTDAQQLTNGLQTCFLKRDSLGVPYGLQNGIVYDNIGYSDTKWTPSGVYQVEEVVVVNGLYTHFVYDEAGNKFTNGVVDGTYTIRTDLVLLNGNSFDLIKIDSHITRRVHIEIQDPLELYQDAVNKGLLS